MYLNKVKRLLRNSLFLVLPLIVSGCGGGSVTLSATDGSKILFKKENSFCQGSMQSMYCTSNGVSTDLTGRKRPFTNRAECIWRGKMWSQDKFACIVNKKFGNLYARLLAVYGLWTAIAFIFEIGY